MSCPFQMAMWTFNRTSLELKPRGEALGTESTDATFNRTSLELKLERTGG